MKLYRGLKTKPQFLTAAAHARYHQLVLRYIRHGERGITRREAAELQTLMRQRRAYFTGKRGVAFQYIGKHGGYVLEIDVPLRDLPLFEVEFQNYHRPKMRFLVYYVNADTLTRNWKRWKGKVHSLR